MSNLSCFGPRRATDSTQNHKRNDPRPRLMATSRVDHLKPSQYNDAPRRYNGGQYVNAQGQVDPTGRNPSEVGPRRQYPLWDRGDAGYLESCSFASKNFNGRKAAPEPRSFDYRDADTYGRRTDGQPLPTIESIYALHAQKYFEYVPWRGRMSEFWDSKWCDLGVPSCGGAFTPSMRLVSISRGRGWFLF